MPTSRRAVAEKQVTFRMSLQLFERLRAASNALDATQATIVSDALERYLDALPAKDRTLIDSLLARRQKP